MKVLMHSEEDLTLSEVSAPDFEIVSEDPTAHYSAMQMFGTSMALCTWSVLASYGEQVDVDTADLTVRIRWDYVDQPFRIGKIDMDIDWPGLPASRLDAAQRAAAMCTLHNTLHFPPTVDTRVTN